MAEELFQFLLKLKEEGVDLSEVDVWLNEFPDSDLNGFLVLVDLFSYDPDDKEITLTEK